MQVKTAQKWRLGENLSQCHPAQHKSHLNWAGIECRPLTTWATVQPLKHDFNLKWFISHHTVNTLLHLDYKNQTFTAKQGNNRSSEIHKQNNNAPCWQKKVHLNVKSDSTQISHLAQVSYRLICCDIECCISHVSIIFVYEGAPQRLYYRHK